MRTQLRQFSGETAVYGVATILQRFLSFLLTPFYTHFLLPEELGVQVDLFVLVAFLLILGNAGMESAFFKFDSVAESDGERRSVLWNAIGVNWLVAGLIGLTLLVVPDILRLTGISRIPETYSGLIRMTGLILALDSMSMVPLALLRMRKRAGKFGVIKIASVIVTVLGNVILVGILDLKLTGIFISALAGSIAQFLLSVPFLRLMLPIRFDAGLRRSMLTFGIPTIGSGLSMIALQLVDRIIVERFVGFEGLGLYQANYRLGIAMVVFVSVFEFAWRPFFLQQASAKNARELFARIFTYFNLIAGGILLAVSFFIPNIAAIPIPFTEDATFIARTYWPGLGLVPIVLAAYLFNGWYTNFIAGIYIEKRTGSLLWLTAGGVAVEVVLCLLLVPSIGIAGGAWATLVAYVAMAIGLLAFVSRVYPVSYEWRRVGLLLGLCGLLFGLDRLFFEYGDLSLTTALGRLGLLLLYPVGLLLLGFLRREEIGILRRLATRGRS